MDFICKKNKKGKLVPHVARVNYDVSPVQAAAVWKGVIEKDSMWAFAKEASYKSALRDVTEKQKYHRNLADNLKKEILANFDENTLYEKFVSFLHEEPDEEVAEWLKKIEKISEL